MGVRISKSSGGIVTVQSDTGAGPHVSGSGVMGPKGPIGIGSATFTWGGALQVISGIFRWPVPMDCQAERVDVELTTPADEDVYFDVNLNGVSIFELANRPKILAGQNHGFSIPDFPDLEQADYLTFDIDQIGNALPGAYLTGVVLLR